jgi:putative sterol carrier protein
VADDISAFFESLPGRVPPANIAGMTNTYVFEISDVGTWRVVVKDGAVAVTEGAGDADATIVMSEETFRKLGAGGSPTRLLMTGKIRVRGDMGAAMKLQKILA